MLRYCDFTQIREALLRTIKKSLVLVFSLCAMTAAEANPELDHVAAGDVTVTQTPGTTDIQQTSQQAIIEWNSFNIKPNETTHFQQPTDGVALNRINPGQGASQIFGTLTATGKIILINQAGIFFGPTAHVDVGGIIASTTDISNENFLSGKYSFDRISPFNAGIINEGSIRAADYGLVALLGNNIENHGYIQARLGNIVLASGDKFTLSFDTNQLINFTIDAPTGATGGITNTGNLLADGGRILVSAQAAKNVLDNVINMGGIVEANSVNEQEGEIILSGGDQGAVEVSGTLVAQGTTSGSQGGTVEVLGNLTHVRSTAAINVGGDAKGGTILIGGNLQGKGPQQNSQTTIVDTGATLNADATSAGDGGKIIVWSNDHTAFHGSISAKGGALSGNGGFAETSGHFLDISGAAIDLTAAHGTTGTWLLDPIDVNIVTAGTAISGITSTNGSATYSPTVTTIDNTQLGQYLANSNITISTSVGTGGTGAITVSNAITWYSTNTLTLSANDTITLNAAITAPSGGLTLTAGTSGSAVTTGASGTVSVYNFALTQGAWSQNGTLPAFSASNNFSVGSNATFLRATSGAGTSGTPYLISDVYGLQGIASLPSTYFRLNGNIDATVTQNWNNGAGFVPIGTSGTPFSATIDGTSNHYIINNLYINLPGTDYVGLVGNLSGTGTLTNFTLTNANITGANYVGALAGNVANGASVYTITATGSVTSFGNTGNVGGIVGAMAAASTWNLYSEVIVSALGTGSNIGGLIGQLAATGNLNSFSKSSSFATGTVYAPNSTSVGGLIGLTVSGSAIQNAFAGGSVTGAAQVGGFIGTNNSTSVAKSYSAGAVTGSGTLVGGFIGNQVAASGMTANYWDNQTSTITSAGIGTSSTGTSSGISGLTTTNSMLLASYSGWDISSTQNTGTTSPAVTWFIFPGSTRPMSVSQEFDIGNSFAIFPVQSPYQFQLMGAALGGTYILSTSIDFTNAMNNTGNVWASNQTLSTGQGFYPLGTLSTGFTGSFNGQFNTVNKIYMNATSYAGYLGVFGFVDTGAAISNVGLTNASVTNNSAGVANVGIFAGQGRGGTYTNLYATGTVSNLTNYLIGGLFGALTNSASLSNSYNAATVIGYNSGTGATNVGGLVGYLASSSSVSNSYNIGSVSSTSSSAGSYVGGLVGYFTTGGNSTITRSYNSGVVSATAGTKGGIVGFSNGGTTDVVTFSFYDSSTSNVSAAVGSGGVGTGGSAIGMTTANMMTLANFNSSTAANGSVNPGWSITSSSSATPNSSTWFMIGGATRPMLITEAFSSNTPLTIVNAHQLELVNANLAASYSLGNNIDMSSAMTNLADVWATNSSTPTGTGFSPIGTTTTGYSGTTFNGNNYQIQNLYINNSSLSAAGLFGQQTSGSIINLGLKNATVTGGSQVGGLVGKSIGGNISNSYVDNGYITGSASGNSIGGLVGYATATVLGNDYSSGFVTGGTSSTNAAYIGGLVGQMQTVYALYSYSNANVLGGGGTGGFVGYNTGSGYIFKSYSSGTVTSNTNSVLYIGGFVGNNWATISNSYSTGNVFATGTVARIVGGFVGTHNSASILYSYSTGSVTGLGTGGTNHFGGFVGDASNNSTIAYSYATGNVTQNTTDSGYAGGFVGIIEGGGALISNSYSTGNVVSYSQAGGFVGVNSAQTLIYTYSTGSVTGNNAIGGYAGFSNTNGISNSYSTGAVITIGTATPTNIGGFVGNYTAASSPANSFWDTQTSGKSNACGGSGSCSSVTGLTTAQSMTGSTIRGASVFGTTAANTDSTISVTGATYAAAAITSPWFMFDGLTRPMLASEEFYISTTTPVANGTPVTAGSPNINNINTGHQLQLVGAALAANYTVSSAIDLSNAQYNPSDIWNTAYGFMPISRINTNFFTGTFNGQSYAIDNLYINNNTLTETGLFSSLSGATLSNIRLTNVNIIGYTGDTGGFAGQGQTTTSTNLSITGSITNINLYTAGGIYGVMRGGTLSNSYNAASVTSINTGGNDVGGLVGTQYFGATITNSYNIGSVSATSGTSSNVGGLVGSLDVGSTGGTNTITNSYNTGLVNGYGNTSGGIVGRLQGNGGSHTGTLSNTYWDTATSGQASPYGSCLNAGTCGTATGGTFNGTTSGSLANINTYSGWSITSGKTNANATWYIVNGLTRPILLSEAFTNNNLTPLPVQNAHQLQLMAAKLDGTYTLYNNINLTSSMNNSADIWGTNQSLGTGSGFSPIGTGETVSASAFSGSFKGSNFIINALYIANSISYTGLFGATSSAAVISNLGLTSAAVSSTGSKVGGLVGFNKGSISATYITGSIASALASASYIGGLVGDNYGAISTSYTAASVIAPLASVSKIGGLTGATEQGGTLSNSYSIGDVYASSTATQVGGLVGYLQSNTGATVLTNSYSTGKVSPTGSTTIGGLVGTASNASASSSFWDTNTSTQSAGVGSSSTLSGITGNTFSGTLSTSGTYSGWSITSTSSNTPNTKIWFISGANGQTRPILISEEFYNNSPLGIQNAHQLQLVSAYVNGNYALTNHVDLASGLSNSADVWGTVGFSPIGFAPTSTDGNGNTQGGGSPFTGYFNGQGYQIKNLTIYLPSNVIVGLFSAIGAGVVNNVGITNASVYAIDQVGILAGNANANSIIQYVYTTGSVTGTRATANQYGTGGIVGSTAGGIIQYSYNAATVTAPTRAGGIAGQLSNSTVSNSYNIGTIIGLQNATGTTTNAYIGGLVGAAGFGGSSTIFNSYSSGYVTASNSPTNIGGLIGGSTSTTVTNSYWDTTTSGQASSPGGGTGLTTANSMLLASYSGWNISSTTSTTATAPSTAASTTAGVATWFIFAGSTRPILLSEEFLTGQAKPIQTAHQLQLVGAVTGSNYILANNIDLNSGMTNAADIWGTDASNGTTSKGFVPITSYSSTFNGQNYTINGLFIRNNTSSAVGLFGSLSTTTANTIKNLGLTNVDITTTSSNTNAGTLVGIAGNSTISNVYATGIITNSGSTNIGGLVGNLGVNSATLKNSYSSVALNNYNLTGTVGIGGLVGLVTTGAVQDSYNTGAINVLLGTGTNVFVGGVIGSLTPTSSTTVQRVYNSGTVNYALSAGSFGGLLGRINGTSAAAILQDSYNIGALNFINTLSSGVNIGGIVGSAVATSSSVIRTYNSGKIAANEAIASTSVGALFGGTVLPATSTNNFYDSTTTGTVGNTNGGTGSSAMTTFSTFSSWGSNITATPSATASAPGGTWFMFAGGTRPMLLMEYNTTVTNAHQLQLMGAALGGSYTLANNINLTSALNNTSDIWASNSAAASGTGFVPIGNSTNNFTGSFNGNNYVLSNLYIALPSTNYVGLFGVVNSSKTVISNIGLVNTIVSGLDWVGALVGGLGAGTVQAAYAAGTVTSTQTSSPQGTGGLVGGTAYASATGGLIQNSYSSATVTGTSNVGGLVGQLKNATIANSYSIGSVTSTQSGGSYIGGLIGGATGNGIIINAYSTGAVTGVSATNIGGFSGGTLNSGNSVTSSFWDTATSGQASSAGGGTAGTFSSLSTVSTFTGWNITSNSSAAPNSFIWFIAPTVSAGATRPMLMSEAFSNNSPIPIQNAHQLQLMAANLTASYSLAANINLASSTTNTAEVWGTNSATPTGAGFVPIGTGFNGTGTPFTGNLSGNGYILDNLYINQSGTTTNSVGLFGNAALPMMNYITTFSLTNVNITGGPVTGALLGNSPSISGNLIGGTISNIYISGTVTGANSGAYLGIGGAIGYALTTPMSIKNIYNTATVVSTASSGVGGLIGNLIGGTVYTSYNSGLVSDANSANAGLIGGGSGFTVYNSFWDTDSSGKSASSGSSGAAGYKGMTSAQMMTLANFTTTGNGFVTGYGWNITSSPSTSSSAILSTANSTWFLGNNSGSGVTRPMLLSELFTSINKPLPITNGHQLQLILANPNASYTLGSNVDLTNGLSNIAEVWGTNMNTPTGSGFAPIGDVTNQFFGNLDGNGYVVNNLYINRSSTQYVGLFGYTYAWSNFIQNIGVTNANISGRDSVAILVGEGRGLLSNVFTTGSVTGSRTSGGFGVGGIVGTLSSFGTTGIINAYSTASVTASGNSNSVGGLVGAAVNFGTSPIVMYSYSTGKVTNSGGGGSGGLIGYGSTQVTAVKNYWDTGTSGMTNGIENTNIAGITAATYSTMNNLSTLYTGWNIAAAPAVGKTWGIISGTSYPYLKAFYPNTPVVIQGSGISGTTVTLAVNGSNLTSSSAGPVQYFTGVASNNTYYFLQANNAISTGSAILAYVNGGTAAAVTTAPAAGASISGFNLAASTLSVGDASTQTLTNTLLASAKGSLTTVYTYSGANITLNSNINLSSNSTTTYNIDGNITSSGTGTLTFLGLVTLAASPTLQTASALIRFANTLNGTGTAGSKSLTLTGNAEFDNVVGGSNALGALSVSGTTLFNYASGNAVTTSNAGGGTGNQTYTGTTTLQLSNITFSATGSSPNGAIALGNIVGNTFGVTVALGGAGTNSTITGIYSGSGGLTVQNSGTLTVSGANTYTGITTINSGTLSINTLGNVNGASSSLGTPTSSGNGTIAIGATGSLQYTGTGDSSDRIINLTASGASIDASGSGALLLSGGITGNTNNLVLTGTGLATESGVIATTSGTLTKSGSGTWTLSGANSYTGTTTISAGTLSINTLANVSGGNSSLGAPTTSGNGTIAIGATGVLRYTGSGHSSDRIINLSASGASIDASGSGALTLSGGVTGNTFNLVLTGTGSATESGAITTTSGSLSKTGTGTWALSGVSTYIGTTTISDGTLSVTTIANVNSASSALGAPTTIGNGTIAIGATGTLKYTGAGHSSDRVINLTGSGGTVDASGAGTLTLTGGVTGNTFNLIITGTGTGIENGTIATTTGSLTKNGTGTWTLGSASNSYTGTTINAGTVTMSNNTVLGSGLVTVNATSSDSTLNLPNNVSTVSNNFVLAGTSTQAATLNNTSGTTLSGTITIPDNAYGTISVPSGNLYTTNTFIGTNLATLTKTGGSTWHMQGDSSATYFGTFIQNSLGQWGAETNGAFGAGIFRFLAGQSTSAAAIGSGVTSLSNSFVVENTNSELHVVTGNSITLSSAFTLTQTLNLKLYSNALTLQGAITGASGFTVDSGVLQLNNTSNTYSGTTIVNGGTFRLGANNASSANSIVNLAGASTVFNLNNFSSSIMGLNGVASSSVTLGSGTLTLGNNTTATSYPGTISGTGGITKIGSASHTLSGSNSYSGITTISAGTLIFNTIANVSGGNSALGAPTSALNGTISIGATGVLQYTGSNSNSDRIINLTASGATIDASGSGALNLSGGITGNTFNVVLTGTGSATESGDIATSTGTLTKNGSGTWTLSGANSYSGSTSLTAGTLIINTLAPIGGGNSSLGAPTTLGNGTISMGANTTLQYTGSGSSSDRVLDLTASGISIDASGSGALLLSGGITGNTFNIILTGTGSATESGDIATTSGSVTKNNSGTWALTGANSYTGSTTINAGTLSINTLANVSGGNSSLGAPTTIGNGTIAIGATGVLQYTGSGNSSDRIINLTASGASIDASGSGALSLSGGITGNTFNLSLTGTGSATQSGVISITSGSVTKNGTGTWALTGANTYTSTTTISAGTLIINTLADVSGGSSSLGAPTTIGNGTIAIGSTGILQYTGSGSSSNRVINLTASGGSIDASGTGALTLSGGITGNTFNLNLTGTGSATESGAISTSTGTVTKSGTGTWTLSSSSSSYTGTTTISNGTLAITTNNALGSTSAGTTVNTGGTLDLVNLTYSSGEVITLNGGTLASSNGSSSFAGNIALNATSSINVTGTQLTLSGIINDSSNNFGITKIGNGTLILSGANTYLGTTTVSNGILTYPVNSTLTNLVVSAGAELHVDNAQLTASAISLSGSGIGGLTAALITTGTSVINGAITLLANSILRTVSAPDTLTIGNAINGAYSLTLNGPGTMTLSGAVGSGTSLASLTSNAGTTILNGGSVNTTGNQTYNSPVSSTTNIAFNAAGINLNTSTVTSNGNQTYSGLVTLGNAVALTSTTGTVTIANGIAGNQNLILNGSANLSGSLGVNNLTIAGNTGTNTLTLQALTGNSPSWNITGSAAGNITGIAEMSGTFNFSNIANLQGGSSGDNTFIFADNGNFAGTINGGNTTGTNTLNYTAYSTPISLNITTLAANTAGGTALNNANTTITTFSNIQNLVSNGQSTLITPNKTVAITLTGGGQGYIDDPILFNGYNSFITQGSNTIINISGGVYNPANGTVTLNGVVMQFSGSPGFTGGTVYVPPPQPSAAQIAAAANTIVTVIASATIITFTPVISVGVSMSSTSSTSSTSSSSSNTSSSSSTSTSTDSDSESGSGGGAVTVSNDSNDVGVMSSTSATLQSIQSTSYTSQTIDTAVNTQATFDTENVAGKELYPSCS